ncbi:hypothetical protein Tco_0475694 [Tanacetum coccineum]
MSKRNLAAVTCSLAQNDLVDYVEEYGIPWCYDPKLPESHQTALDAPKGYIPLYLSLFTIGNLRFPLNDFCLDVFEFFQCHFPLLNSFGVARVTTFVVACKAYGWEASVPLFRAFLTVGSAGDWLTFQKRHGSNIHTLFGSFSYSYPTEPFDEALWNRLRCHTLDAQTFPEPILYLAGLSSSWEHAPSNPSIFVDGEEMAFRNFMKKPGQSPSFFVRLADQPVDVGSPSVEPLWSIADNDQAESSSLLKDKGVFGFELVVVREGILGQSANAVGEGSKRSRSITESLEEEATMVKMVSKKKKLETPRRMSARDSILPPPTTVPKGTGKHPQVLARFVGSLANSSDSLAPDVEEAHVAHNMISGFHCPLLKDKLGFLSFDKLVDVFDVHALQTTVVGNMLTNESCFLCQGHAKLKNDLVSLKSKKSLLEHEISKLEDRLAKAQRNQDVEGSQVVKDLRSENARILKEVSMLRGVAASAEESRKEISEELSGLRPHLEEADCLKQPSLSRIFFSTVALDEVHGLGDSWNFKVVKDYHPEAEKLFDEAAEALYKLKFPYISLLSRKASQSLEKLSVVEAPSIQETPFA